MAVSRFGKWIISAALEADAVSSAALAGDTLPAAVVTERVETSVTFDLLAAMVQDGSTDAAVRRTAVARLGRDNWESYRRMW